MLTATFETFFPNDGIFLSYSLTLPFFGEKQIIGKKKRFQMRPKTIVYVLILKNTV